MWCRLEDIANIGTGATPNRLNKEYYNNGIIPWINSSSTNCTYITEASEYITEKAINETNCKIYPIGTLIVAMYGEGKTRGQVSELLIESATNQACAAISLIDTNIKAYIKNYFEGNYFHLRKLAEGGNQPNLSIGKISNYTIPLPPLSEQHRITTEIEKCFSIIDIIECGKADLQTAIKQAKSKILDLAIHGKLVPQDPNDEPAIELLKRINPDFTPCDNGHYAQLPDGWCYATIKEAFIINPKNKADDDIEVGFVPMANITDGYNNTFKYETKRWGKIKTGFTHFANGDIAVAKISPCLENRKSVVLKGLPNGIGAGTTELHVFRSLFLDVQYGLNFFKSDYFISQCVGSFNGVVGQQRVSKNIIENMIIAIPPINEQKRIACAVHNIFAKLDMIMESL